MSARGTGRFWARLYETALLALPSRARSERGYMAAALEEQLEHAPGRRSAALAILRAFVRLPALLAVEWIDLARSPRGGHGPASQGRRGMLVQNLRFAARTLRKSRTFSTVSVILIGLGVGAVTAVFTVVDHVLLRPLPYPEEHRLVYLDNGAHNGATLRALPDVESFDLWVAARNQEANLTRVDAEPLRLRGSQVSASFFSMFGARPLLGRLLVDDDSRDRSVAVLTHAAWMSVWGGDPTIVGTAIQLDSQPVTVVGILDESFVSPEQLVPRGVQLFRPMDWDDPRLDNPGFHAHWVTARLGPGVEIASAQAEMDRLQARLLAEDLLAARRPESWPLVPLKDETVQDARDGLVLLLGSVALLLLVACANVALLFMARGIARVREMSVRRALGAGTRVLLGQLVAESLLVGFAGGLVGLTLAYLGLGGFERWIGDLPRAEGIVLDTRVLLFTVLLSAVTALVFGLAPALRSIRQDVSSQLRESGRTATEGRNTRWVRGGLIVGEVSISLVLVALAGLLLRSFLAVTSQDPGVRPEGVWVIPVNMAGVDANAEYRQRMGALLEAIDGMPGVQSAAYGLEMPFQYVGGGQCCWAQSTALPNVVDVAAEGVRTTIHPVTARFFETLGTDLVAGTAWSEADVTADSKPVVLNEVLAIRHFGSAQAALGQELQFNSGRVRIVGVAEKTLHYGLDQEHGEALYVPIEAIPFPAAEASFAVRAADGSAVTAEALRRTIWSLEPDQPLPSVVPMQTWIDDSSGVRRLSSALSSAFGLVALLLAAGGLYGTQLYAANQRRRELGIRIALGAGRGRIQGQVLADGVGLAVVGLLLGVPSAIYLGRLLETFLWNVSSTDPWSLAVAAFVLLATAALASWLPAHRAARTDPLEVLRAD